MNAPVLFGRRFVIPSIVEYLRRYPGMQVEAVFLDRVVNLVEEGLDVAVRIGALPDSSMQALKVGEVRLLLASPAYIALHGAPRRPEDLRASTVIASSAGSFSPGWRFHYPDGERTVKVQPRLNVTTNGAAIAAAVEGFGITRVLSYQVASQISRGSLQILLPTFDPPPRPVHIVHREGRYSAAKVRAFIDLLAQRLRTDGTL